MATTIAFIGTGAMGAEMAGNLQRAGFPLRVWNRSGAKAKPLTDAGAAYEALEGRATEGKLVLIP